MTNAPLSLICRDCRRLLVHTEEVLRRFCRNHKCTVGSDLHQQAMVIMCAMFFAMGVDASLMVRAPACWLVLRYRSIRSYLKPEGATP